MKKADEKRYMAAARTESRVAIALVAIFLCIIYPWLLVVMIPAAVIWFWYIDRTERRRERDEGGR